MKLRLYHHHDGARVAYRDVARHGRLRHVYVVEQLAELVARHYEVRQRDRRVGERRTGSDRRDR